MRHELPREEVLGPRYAVRVGQLQSWHVLHVTCSGCGHVGAVHQRKLIAKCGEHARLIDVERRFRCAICRNRDGNAWRVMRLPR